MSDINALEKEKIYETDELVRQILYKYNLHDNSEVEMKFAKIRENSEGVRQMLYKCIRNDKSEEEMKFAEETMDLLAKGFYTRRCASIVHGVIKNNEPKSYSKSPLQMFTEGYTSAFVRAFSRS